MNLVYVTRSKIPSRHANAVQVTHMICALAPLVTRLDAHLPGSLSRRLRLWTGTLFSAYGKKVPDNVHVHFHSDGSEHAFEKSVLAVLPKTDLIFTRSPWLAWQLAEQNAPMIFESHVVSRDAEQMNWPAFIRAINASKDAAVVAISERIAQEYIAGGLHPQRTFVAPDGVDVDAFARSEAGGLGRLFGPAVYERPVMVYTGSLSPEKGAEFLAQAAVRLPRLNVAIIGGTAKESAKLQKNAPPNLFTHPAVPHRDVPAILHDAAILVMPYMPEGTLTPYMSPLKLFEYLATGRPVISADLPVLRPFLQNGVNCFLFAPGAVDDLCAQTTRILDMKPTERNAMRDRQQANAARQTWEHRAQAILDWHGALRKETRI